MGLIRRAGGRAGHLTTKSPFIGSRGTNGPELVPVFIGAIPH